MKNKTPTIILIVVILVALFGFNAVRKNNSNSPIGTTTNGVQVVNPTEFAELIKEGNGFLVDVHIPEQTHIPGTDAFIPYNEVASFADQLPADKSTPILVYCRSGSMSESASQEIASLGYTNIYDLEGGINAYREQNNEVVITPSNQDLGTVTYGDVPTTDFTLTNFTPLPVKVTRISTSCGCTTAEVEQEELGAYESTVIKVAFDPAIHKDDTDLGELTRTIYIDTDNSNYPKLTSTITANVIKQDE